MKNAIVRGGVAVEMIPASDVPVEDRYHPDIIAEIQEVPEEIEEGWVKVGNSWSPPPLPEAAEPPPAPTKADLMARVLDLQAQIEALSD